MARGRRKDEIASVRLRLGEGNIKLGMDKEVDELYRKIEALPRGTRFRTVMKWLLTGSRLELRADDSDLNEIRKAADEIIENFVV